LSELNCDYDHADASVHALSSATRSSSWFEKSSRATTSDL
jgi:hypothetical protein